MREQDKHREALRKVSAESVGERVSVVNTWTFSKVNSPTEEQIRRLPIKQNTPVQVLDPADPDFGKFYFLTDYDPIG